MNNKRLEEELKKARMEGTEACNSLPEPPGWAERVKGYEQDMQHYHAQIDDLFAGLEERLKAKETDEIQSA